MKTKSIQVPVTPKEREQFHALAKAHHKPLAILIREFLYRLLEEKKKGVAA